MPFSPTPIPDLQVFEPRIFGDERGYFYEAYNQLTFVEAGIGSAFVQDNQAFSTKGILRGLHRQAGQEAQAKLVRVVSGTVFDVAVDMREGSPTRYEWFGIVLSGENHKQLFIPRGFAHGYLVLSHEAVFTYKCDNFYAPGSELGMRYDDPAIGIEWPVLGVPYRVAERDLAWSYIDR